jgi:uncharacterized membrane protein
MTGNENRILEMDAVRGAAMIGVVFSHSAAFLTQGDHPEVFSALSTIGMFATPTFLLLSGVLCGFLRDSGARDEHSYRLTLLGRGLFLLTVGHMLLGLTHWVWQPFTHAMWQSVYVTDAVGVGLIIASGLPRRMTRNALLTAGASLLVVSWAAAVTLTASHPVSVYLLRIAVGMRVEAGDQDPEGWIVPIVPYLGIFLLGMAGGVEYARRAALGKQMRDVARFCARIGIACVSLGIVAKLIWLGARPGIATSARPLFHFLTEPRSKIPPGPVYLLVFGGSGILLAGIVALRVNLLRHLIIIAATLGQASLIMYVLQYWLTSVPTHGFGLRGGLVFWCFAVSIAIAVLIAMATLANRLRLNRWLTAKPLLLKMGSRISRQWSEGSRESAGNRPESTNLTRNARRSGR